MINTTFADLLDRLNTIVGLSHEDRERAKGELANLIRIKSVATLATQLPPNALKGLGESSDLTADQFIQTIASVLADRYSKTEIESVVQDVTKSVLADYIRRVGAKASQEQLEQLATLFPTNH